MKYTLLLTCLPAAVLVITAGLQGRYVLAVLSLLMFCGLAHFGIEEVMQP